MCSLVEQSSKGLTGLVLPTISVAWVTEALIVFCILTASGRTAGIVKFRWRIRCRPPRLEQIAVSHRTVQAQPAVGRARVRVERCLLVAGALGLEGEVGPDVSQAKGAGVEEGWFLNFLGPRAAKEACLAGISVT